MRKKLFFCLAVLIIGALLATAQEDDAKERRALELLRAGEVEQYNGNFELALKLFGQAYELTPDNGYLEVLIYDCKTDYAEELVSRGKAMIAKSDWENALSAFRRAGQIAPEKKLASIREGIVESEKGFTEYLLITGDDALKEGDWKNALEAYRKAEGIASERLLPFIQKGIAKSESIKQYEEERAGKGLVKFRGEWVDPEDESRVLEIERLGEEGDRFYGEKNYAKALEAYKAFLRIEPGDLAVEERVKTCEREIAMAEEKKARRYEEEQKAKGLMKYEGEWILPPVVKMKEAEKLYNEGKWREALTYYKSALELDPGYKTAVEIRMKECRENIAIEGKQRGTEEEQKRKAEIKEKMERERKEKEAAAARSRRIRLICFALFAIVAGGATAVVLIFRKKPPAKPEEEAPKPPVKTPAPPVEEAPALPAEEAPVPPAEEAPTPPPEETPTPPPEETPASPEEAPTPPPEEAPAPPAEEPKPPEEEAPKPPEESEPKPPEGGQPEQPDENQPKQPE